MSVTVAENKSVNVDKARSRNGGEGEEEARTLGTNERQTPRKRIHEIRKPIRMRARVVLPNRDILICVLEHRTPILIDIEVIGSGEDRDDRREVFLGCFSVHRIPGINSILLAKTMLADNADGSSVPSVLGFVTTYHREKVVPLEELADGVVPEENQTSI
jgi:hypothetical protein